jgi:hypothetical protein
MMARSSLGTARRPVAAVAFDDVLRLPGHRAAPCCYMSCNITLDLNGPYAREYNDFTMMNGAARED